jgi:hypothetical protein
VNHVIEDALAKAIDSAPGGADQVRILLQAAGAARMIVWADGRMVKSRHGMSPWSRSPTLPNKMKPAVHSAGAGSAKVIVWMPRPV